MLFKRALFAAGKPIVVFLNAEKLGDPWVPNKCYSVFGPDFTMRTAIDTCPIALCIGYDMDQTCATGTGITKEIRKGRNKPEWISNTLQTLGFHVPYVQQDVEAGGGAVMFANEQFRKLLPDD